MCGATPGPVEVDIRRADLARDDHARDVVAMVDAYASDVMGGGQRLADGVRARLAEGLRSHPTTLAWLAYRGPEPVGVAVAFLGFSTFAALPLLNVHDLAVVPSVRGLGVGRRLLEAVEAEARALGCCKVTLEVLEGNDAARGLYERMGFRHVHYADGAGGALFYAKSWSAAQG
ncbi:MAG: GNAT family N-acetyltransferase [Lacipirellulaceae bacterium]